MHTGFWWRNLRERDEENKIEIALKQYDGSAWTGLIWLRTGTSTYQAALNMVLNLWDL
jgi:hypothetical protein